LKNLANNAWVGGGGGKKKKHQQWARALGKKRRGRVFLKEWVMKGLKRLVHGRSGGKKKKSKS